MTHQLIAPLRNYGWKLSNHLRGPSRQVVGSEGKKAPGEISPTKNGRRQSKGTDSPCSRRGQLYPRSELRDTSTIATNHL